MTVRNLIKTQLAWYLALLIFPGQLLFTADVDPNLTVGDVCQYAL
jgi:hypothetical protein